jgi:hypothetical protein
VVESPAVAVYDANVLYALPVCDCLMWVALGGLVRAHWTAEIHEEWIRNLLARRPDLTRGQLERRRDFMDTALPNAVVKGHRKHVRTLRLPDPNDRHVLAAAITAVASHIVTYNTKDFPGGTTKPYGIVAVHPDEFLADMFTTHPDAVLACVRMQRASMKRLRPTPEQMISTFRKVDLCRFAELLETRIGELSTALDE